MNDTSKSMRLQIGLFGRTNVGKSSFLNMIAGQDVAVTSPVPGTTTDVVEKSMELLPVGPVVFLDTGGLDDSSVLAEQRVKRTMRVFDRADVAVLITEPDVWSQHEEQVLIEAAKKKMPVVIVVNKIDKGMPAPAFLENLDGRTKHRIQCSCCDGGNRDRYVNAFKDAILEACPENVFQHSSIMGDLLPAGGLAVLIVPIDLEAPKGRLILPQVQTIRDALDNDAAAIVVKEREFADVLSNLKRPPDLVVCDSQVVMKMVADTPDAIKCTTFSILFARFKGDLVEEARGAAAVNSLKTGDKVLIAEACSHHAMADDIGRVKIPRWLRQYTGLDLQVDVRAGRDYPENLGEYRLAIHCGGCMLTRREKLMRIQKARQAGVPITNYGICISFLQGVLQRVLSPFPAALSAFEDAEQSFQSTVRGI